MNSDRDNSQVHPPRILYYSHKNIYEQEVWRASFFEFEQILQQIDSVDIVAPQPRSWYRNGKRLALRLGERVKRPIDPGLEPVRVTKDYDVFFAVCEKPSELLHINAVKGWKDRCKTSFCLLTEFWIGQMAMHKSCLEVLSQFDHVLFMFAANDPFRKYIRGTGRYMAAGIDALRFCPYPNPPARSIDVLSIGRRSQKTHQALLRLAAEKGIFYVHDTINSLATNDIQQHRRMMADFAKRSRYFLVNPGKIDNPGETGGQVEFGYRYFEGAAPGMIMIGEIPRNNEFPKIFNWEDVVIPMPFDSEDIGSIMKELDRQPERQMNIRRNNITQVLQHHDWAHRWKTVLEIAGIDPLPALAGRIEELQRRTAMVQEGEAVARPAGGR
jgi:hypothetical protein